MVTPAAGTLKLFCSAVLPLPKTHPAGSRAGVPGPAAPCSGPPRVLSRNRSHFLPPPSRTAALGAHRSGAKCYHAAPYLPAAAPSRCRAPAAPPYSSAGRCPWRDSARSPAAAPSPPRSAQSHGPSPASSRWRRTQSHTQRRGWRDPLWLPRPRLVRAGLGRRGGS